MLAGALHSVFDLDRCRLLLPPSVCAALQRSMLSSERCVSSSLLIHRPQGAVNCPQFLLFLFTVGCLVPPSAFDSTHLPYCCSSCLRNTQVAAFCANKRTLTTDELKILQQKVAQISIQTRGGSGDFTVPSSTVSAALMPSLPAAPAAVPAFHFPPPRCLRSLSPPAFPLHIYHS